jgi:hypothetical protein
MSSRCSPLIVMMQPIHVWNFPDPPKLRPLDRPRYRTIHLQGPVRTPMMVILNVPGQEPPEMSLVQDDHVIQAFTADTPDQPLDIRILPRTSWGNRHCFDAQMPHPLPKGVTIDPIAVAEEIPRGLVPWERVHDLLGRPCGGGMFRDIEVHDASPFVSEDHEDEEYPERRG